MPKLTDISPYHNSILKKLLDLGGALYALILTFPLIIATTLAIKLENHGPVIFRQIRIGKNGKPFLMYKFRTMKVGAEKERSRLMHLNIADGPVFKIPNDPRYTGFGRVLVKTGLDELPQLINVIKGEMSLVGPRPLPDYESVQLTKKQQLRQAVLPGIVSSWVIEGAHRLKFKTWIALDKDYIENANLITDLRIIVKTCLLILKLVIKKAMANHHSKLINS